jgi:hypothetical protein
VSRAIRRTGAILVLICAGSLAHAASAPAAVGIDETFTPAFEGCGGTFIVTGAPPGKTFAAPFAGVISSWAYTSTSIAPQIKLKAMRPAGGANYTAIGESAVEHATANGFNSFQTRIPIQAGDIIGFTLVTNGGCRRFDAAATGWSGRTTATDPAVGTTVPFSAEIPNNQYEIAALLEPDADADGFGDETQDNCLGVPNPDQADADGDGVGAACEDEIAPDTTITGRPKDKTKKKTATFEFSSSEPGSSFQCSVDGEAPKACSSPLTVKVGKGKHTFSVQATDGAGNRDQSAATDDWKVKKKKKKK